MEDRKGLGQSLLLAVAPALVSSLMTGVATWSLAVRDAKRASTEQATERDQVVFTTLRDRIAAIEGSVEDMTKVVEKVARPGSHISAARSTPRATPTPARTEGLPPAKSPSEAPPGSTTGEQPDGPDGKESEGGKRVLFEVLDRLKAQLPKSPLPKNVHDLPLYTTPKK